jgi:Cu+-exporting ATPase
LQEPVTDKKTRIILKIGGMTCAGCVNVIQNHLLNIDGVEKCEVNLGAEKVVLEYDSQITDVERLEQSVKDAGYKVVYEKLAAKIEGLTDASDAQGLEKKLATNTGIKQVSVNYGNGQVMLEYSPTMLSLSDIRKILKDSGYEIISEDMGSSVEEVEARKT